MTETTTLTWHELYKITRDVLKNNRDSNITSPEWYLQLGTWDYFEAGVKQRELESYCNKLCRTAIMRDWAWHNWFNENITPILGLSIDRESWIETILDHISTTTFSTRLSQNIIFNPDTIIKFNVVNGAKFTLFLLSQQKESQDIWADLKDLANLGLNSRPGWEIKRDIYKIM